MQRAVNNEIYESLGERWYEADDDPVALLRAESRLRNPWLAERLLSHCGARARVLDVGCGAGILANFLAEQGFAVTGLDASVESLAVAARHDAKRSAIYLEGDARALPFADSSFDAVCAMDFLEHVEDQRKVVAECARVVRPGGLFFFHTFNRNTLAWLIVIKGVEWVVRNTPRDLHVLHLFMKPAELARLCGSFDLDVREFIGVKPVLWSRAFLRLLVSGKVPSDFRFEFTRSTLLGYSGYAERRQPRDHRP